VNLHQGHEFGVVDLHATNIMSDHECSPGLIHILVVWQECHCQLDGSNTPRRLILGETVSVLRHRARTDIPEFGYILEAKMKDRALRDQIPYRLLNHAMLCVILS